VRVTAISDRNEILSLLRDRIVGFACKRLRHREDAEDLAQDVLLLIDQKYPEVTALEELVPLSLQVMRFKMLALWRKRDRRGENRTANLEEIHAVSGDDPEKDAIREQQARCLARGIAMLSERCQRIFALKLAGQSFREIQHQMGAKSVNTVYTWDFRCRQRLREVLEQPR
jgi:RNA polymerase sigma-70 factor (ECF subfamily)